LFPSFPFAGFLIMLIGGGIHMASKSGWNRGS
jgi:hypothetical protein